MNVSEDAQPAERMRGAYLTHNTFKLLRMAPILGRDFVSDDDRIGAPGVAILSYEVWQNRYAGDPGIVGRSIRVNSIPATIVGVMPPGFAYPMTAQVWQPLAALPGLDPAKRSVRNLNVVGRLMPSADLAVAKAELDALTTQIIQAYPEAHKGLRVQVELLHSARAGGPQAILILSTLMAAATMVLLIACANVANLMLARAAGRSREMAVRASLGAGRWRIIRQLLIESALISAIAVVVGLALSRYLAGLMAVAFNVYEIGAPGGTVKPYWVNLGFDITSATFLGGLALAVSVIVGIIPAWHLSRTGPSEVLKDGGRGTGATVRAQRLTGALLIGQLALTLLLLTNAALQARSYLRLYFTDLVIDTKGVVTMRIALPMPKYAGVEKQRQFIRLLEERLSTVPLFTSTAIGSDIPLQPLGFGSREVTLDGQDRAGADEPPSAFFVAAGSRYLETLGVPLVEGRALTPADEHSGQEGVIVNQRFRCEILPRRQRAWQARSPDQSGHQA